ncbi:MAG: hypothetical protein OT477_18550 [Chloroflexi bacterium]|nr:hypothetical protein [Chloroflexota bacterium]
MQPAFTHHTTPHSDTIHWSNWAGRWGATQYLTVLGVGMQALLVGVGTAVASRWVAGYGWGVLAAVCLWLAWLVLRQLLPLFQKRTLIISAQSLTVYDIDWRRTTSRQFTAAQVQAVLYTKRASGDWEAMLWLVYKVRPFGREQLELTTHYPLAPWLHTADQQALHTLLCQILTARHWGEMSGAQ